MCIRRPSEINSFFRCILDRNSTIAALYVPFLYEKNRKIFNPVLNFRTLNSKNKKIISFSKIFKNDGSNFWKLAPSLSLYIYNQYSILLRIWTSGRFIRSGRKKERERWISSKRNAFLLLKGKGGGKITGTRIRSLDGLIEAMGGS